MSGAAAAITGGGTGLRRKQIECLFCCREDATPHQLRPDYKVWERITPPKHHVGAYCTPCWRRALALAQDVRRVAVEENV